MLAQTEIDRPKVGYKDVNGTSEIAGIVAASGGPVINIWNFLLKSNQVVVWYNKKKILF